MGHTPLHLSGSQQHVTLNKDKKVISRAVCLHPPIGMPDSWNISEIKAASKYELNGLRSFILYGAFENIWQKREWERFLDFLRSSRRVAAADLGEYIVYILPPADTAMQLSKCPVKVVYIPRNITHVDAIPNISQSSACQPFSDILGHSSKEIAHNPNEDIAESSQVTVRRQDAMPCESMPGEIHDVKLLPNTGDPCDYLDKEVAVPKNYVKTDPSYLRTLSQTHSGWIFGALAELVDNSRDAKATRLDISVESFYSKKAGGTIPVLSVVDDGAGMSHKEIVRMLSFGHKQPDQDDPDHIGKFGIGFKTGAMRLGRDAIVLTQNVNSRSVALLSQSFNEDNDVLEIPIVSYYKKGCFMEVDTTLVSEASAEYHLKAIKEFSPFNEYFIGEKLAHFGVSGTGTQIFIWNLDKWGSSYSLDWVNSNSQDSIDGDIIIRSRRIRSRPGQISQKVPLDYSLRCYLEVIFLDPRMKIYVQGSLVKSRPLAKFLNKTVVVQEDIMGRPVELTLGYSHIEWQHVNCGMFLYWHGRLIEAYKRVGGMVHNADMGRGVIGVIDVTNLMDDGNGHVLVLSNKQGFQDSEVYAKLEEWLGGKSDEYWDANFDKMELMKGNSNYKPDDEWVQCEKCRKWRMLTHGFNSDNLPKEWFCYMPPFNGACRMPEQKVGPGIITVSTKRTGGHCKQEKAEVWQRENLEAGGSEDDTSLIVEDASPPKSLKRMRRGPVRSCKKKKK